MKTLTVLFIVFTMSSHLGIPQHTTIESQVIQADAQLNEYILTNNLAKAELVYENSFILTTPSGKAKTKSDMLTEIGSPDLKLEINETQNVQVRVLNNTAILTGKLHQKGIYKGQSFDVFLSVTDTWVKTKAGWKLFAGHATLIPKP